MKAIVSYIQQLSSSFCIWRRNLTFTTLRANSVDDTLIFSLIFPKKTGFDISCKLSPLETIAWNVKSCFSGKKYLKNTSSAETFSQSAKRFKKFRHQPKAEIENCYMYETRSVISLVLLLPMFFGSNMTNVNNSMLRKCQSPWPTEQTYEWRYAGKTTVTKHSFPETAIFVKKKIKINK